MLTLSRRNRFFPTIWDEFLKDSMINTNGVSNVLPAVNVKEGENEFTIELAAPGLTKEDFKIKLEEDLLTISRTSEEKKEETEEKRNYTRKEFSFSSFSRSFRLPDTIDGEKIDANYTDGVLYLALPKKEEAKAKPPREIAIS